MSGDLAQRKHHGGEPVVTKTTCFQLGLLTPHAGHSHPTSPPHYRWGMCMTTRKD
jgi:hypothetical protein